MKKTILITLFTAAATLLITLSVFEIKAQRDQLSADNIETIDSKILNESRKLLVHLPKNYHANPNKNYPVVYALDATSHDQDVLNAAVTLSSARLLPDIIVVGVLNVDRKLDLTPNYIMVDKDPSELGNGQAFLEFLEKEAIPQIEKKYRTTGYRMLSGNSRAGLFSFFAFLEQPTLFDAYFCYSPAFWRNENLIVAKAKTFLEKESRLDQFVYISLGDKENDKMKSGYDAMVEVLNHNNSTRLISHFTYTTNANHSSNAYYSIPHALNIWNEAGKFVLDK